MARYDRDYPQQIAPEQGDKFLISAAQDGQIMWISYNTLLKNIEMRLNVVDDELSDTSLHPVQNRVITQAINYILAQLVVDDELSDTSLHPVQNRVITQAINDILAQLHPSDDKEIISVLTYSDDAPDSVEEGDLFINSDTNELLERTAEEWIPVEAKENVIYLTDDTTHFYIFQHGAFTDMTGQPIDNTIYVNDLDELDAYTDDGVYRVCHTSWASITMKTIKWYTFIIERRVNTRSHRIYITQTLTNQSGYQTRQYIVGGSWSEWEVHTFSYEDHKHVLADITDVVIAPVIEASEVIPIESATLRSIAHGTYEPADTAMFTGHPDYTPLTAAEVTELVGTAMEAFRAARKIQEENQ